MAAMRISLLGSTLAHGLLCCDFTHPCAWDFNELASPLAEELSVNLDSRTHTYSQITPHDCNSPSLVISLSKPNAYAPKQNVQIDGDSEWKSCYRQP